ncbi:hypothetical protein JCM8115_001972 [Rhodotorula mucilaginosa]|nr:hypothetical protein B0A53_05436 [Rhodotorula sp. CCFEE 5036]
MAQDEAHENRPEAPQPVASTSTARPSPTKDGALNGASPVRPRSVVAHAEQGHSRRPSRAERYESVIANARETLRRATGGYDEAELQVGPSSDPLSAERRRRSVRLSSASFEPLPGRDWRETVRSLLNVVEGMSQQLASHDELATELKIAQSNLSLASAHSEFLEETLRRRDSRNSASHLMSRQHSTGEQLPGLPSQSRRGSADVPAHDSGAATGLFGLGLSAEPDATGAKSFFRLPSKRRSPNPAAPAASESTASTFTRRLRSVGSSPALNKGFFSSEPAPPLPPRASTSTTASNEFGTSPNPSIDTGNSASPLAAEVFSLRTQVASLETECTALRSNNASLKRNNETLVNKCADLEKTKDDLLSELENLSVELFSEANALVAEERRARAKAEEEVERLTAQLANVSADLDSLRSGGQISLTTASSPSTKSPRPPSSSSQPTTPLMPAVNGGQPFSSSPTTSPVAAETVADRPQSVASIASSAARNWFSFGRAASSQSTPATELLPPLPTPSPIAASVETLGDSSVTGKRDSPHAILNASPRPETTSSSLAVDRTSAQSIQQREHNLPPLPTSKGKEKARTLDLGISIPDAEGIEDSRGVASAFSSSPGSADTAAPVRLPNLGETTRGAYAYSIPSSVQSPRSPLLPAVPADGAFEITSSSGSRDAATVAGADANGVDGALAVPTRRPRRPEAQAAPRPHAMHYERTPPGLHADFFPAAVGGPSASEMTAGAKSPKSPNELRWAKVSGTLPPSAAAASSAASMTSQQYSSSQHSRGGKEPRRRAATTDLRSSPALSPNDSSSGRPPRAEEPLHRRPSAPVSPIPPHSSPSQQQHRPTLLPVDTTSSTLAPPLPDSGTHRRPHSAGVGAARPGFPRTNDGSAPYSTAQAALSSGPASANPAGTVSTFAGPAPNRSPLLSQAPPPPNGSFSAAPSSATYPMQQRGMTPSTSLSSLPSNSSLSSSVGALSSSGHSTLSGAGGGGSRHGLAGSPDDTKAAQDLENLMQNILEMSEGLFGQDGVDGVGAVAAAGGGERKPSSGPPDRSAADSQ